MPDVSPLLSSPIVDLLGWTLLHFVWQGALLAGVLAGVLYVLRAHSPRVRYAVSGAALVALLALPVGTAAFLAQRAPSPPSSPTVTTRAIERPVASAHMPAESTTAAPSVSWRDWLTRGLHPMLPWIVAGWALGVLGFSARLIGGAWHVRRLRRSGAPAPERWRTRLGELAERMGLRRPVHLRRTDRVEGPMVAGWLRPVVLVPAGLLSGLPPAQVEALLLHELAHVRRHDVLVGRLQGVVETLLFPHPATWWISGRVREAREACCDDRAVAAGTDRAVYARALTALAERVVSGRRPAGVVGASDGSLLARIRRLLSPPEAPSARAQRFSLVAALLLLLSMGVVLAACASQQTASETSTPELAHATTGPDTTGGGTRAGSRSVETRRTTIVTPDGVATVDTSGGAYVVRSGGGHVDTLDLPEMGLGQSFVDADSLRRAIERQVNPDSLRRAIEESQRRIRRMQLNADSVARAMDFGPLSDSLARALAGSASVDSVLRWHHEHADSLRRHVERIQKRLQPRLEALQDSLRPRLEQMQDSLRREWARDVPEQLREQARRLREQAERLEEQAEQMQRRDGPSPPKAPGASEPSSWNRGEAPFLLQNLRATVNGQEVASGISLRGDGYYWVRGPEAVYVFAAMPFNGSERVGAFEGATLTVPVGEHEVRIRSEAERPIYRDVGTPVYARRLPLSEVEADVATAGMGTSPDDAMRHLARRH